MEKNNKKVNTLIKKNQLITELNKKGIKRINSMALLKINQFLEGSLDELGSRLKEEIDIKGKKTLDKEDVERVVKEFNE